MSITIKNLDIPIGCQKCKFFRKHIFGNGLDYSYSCILGAKEFPMPWIRQLDNRAVDCPIIEADKERSDKNDSSANLCDSCVTEGCIFQTGIVRSHCDFYKAESEE